MTGEILRATKALDDLVDQLNNLIKVAYKQDVEPKAVVINHMVNATEDLHKALSNISDKWFETLKAINKQGDKA